MTDITQLPRAEKLARSKKQMMWFAIASLIMMFAGLTSAYIVSSSRRDWTDFELPQEFYYSTGVILLSSLALILAKRSIINSNMKAATGLTIVTFVLGAIFVAMQFMGFETLISMDLYFTGEGSNVRASYIYIIVMAHLAHIVAGLISLLVITVQILRNKYSHSNFLGFELGAIFWHFVDLLWIFLLCFLLYF
jgi:cytochrome c oxidase subunit 3